MTTREPWLTKRELAAALSISTRTVTRLRLPCTRVGGQNRYLLSQVEAHLRGVSADGGDVLRFPVERARGAAA
jgi:hypothetical protein